MVRDIIKRGIINTLQATLKDLWWDAANRTWGLIADGTDTGGAIATGNAVSSIFEPFPMLSANPTLQISTVASVAEVRQLAVVDDGGTPETVLASTRYRIRLFPEQRRYEKAPKEFTVAYTTPAVLSGVPATDRANLYTVLRDKINRLLNSDVVAYLVFYYTYSLGGATGNETPVIGALAIQTTSAAVATFLRIGTLTGGSWGAGSAAGNMWMGLVSGTLDPGTKTWAYGVNSTLTQTTGTVVQGCGLAILDNAGYWRSTVARGGKTQFALSGWTTMTNGTSVAVNTQVHIAVAAAYAVGIGTDMLSPNRYPQFDLTKQDIFLGSPDLIINGVPVVGHTYTTLIVMFETTELTTSGETEHFRKWFYCYLDEASGGNLTNLINGITAQTGFTVLATLPVIW